MRIIQLCLILSILVTIIFVAIIDASHLISMFYTAIALIVVFGLWLMRANEEFIEHMNNKYKKREE